MVIPAISVGLHALGTLVPGPNGRLYLGAGAEQDALAGGHVTSGTVVSFKGDGSDLRIEAKGLRGPFGLAFIPGTASLLVTDDGRDDLGVRRPPDELNLVRDVTLAAPDFGFPDCYDQGGRACAATPLHATGAAGGYDASTSVFATGFGEQDPLGTAIGPGGAVYVTLFGHGAVVRFFPGYDS